VKLPILAFDRPRNPSPFISHDPERIAKANHVFECIEQGGRDANTGTAGRTDPVDSINAEPLQELFCGGAVLFRTRLACQPERRDPGTERRIGRRQDLDPGMAAQRLDPKAA
jgi:hypothetical protein